jgi:two-component system sensor histidine kinase HydH
LVISKRIRRLSLPAFALVVAILATATLLLFTTRRSLDREKERMSHGLERQATVLVRALESGARTGMMERWGSEQLQALLEDAGRLREIAYIGIFDGGGTPVAVFSRDIAVPPWPEPTEVRRIIEGGEPVFATRDIDRTGIFEVSRKFVPRNRRGRMGRMMARPHPPLPGTGEEWAIVLGLHTGPWEKVLQETRRQTLLSFIVILTTGSLALYLIIILQNYFVVRRTLSEMREYSQNILENMADGLLSAGLDGKVATGNPEASRILGMAGKDPKGQELKSLLPEVAEAFGAVLEGRRGKREFEVALRGGGTSPTPVGVALSPLKSEEGEITGAVLLLRDLTEVRRLEERIRESEKLAAIGQMAATVAHEIRNPLSSLKGFAQLFARKFTEGSPEAGYAALMVREVDRLNRTISDLLFYSRPVSLRRGRVNISHLLGETVRLLEPDFRSKGQTVELDSADEVAAEVDPDQMSRVFLNVLLNAHQAAGEGGRISVTVSENGGSCRVEVGNSGPGMAPESAARAFEPFFTTREKGSGLGLSIVKKIVDLHEGRVTLESSAEEGTKVVIELPLTGGEHDQAG